MPATCFDRTEKMEESCGALVWSRVYVRVHRRGDERFLLAIVTHTQLGDVCPVERRIRILRDKRSLVSHTCTGQKILGWPK